MLEIKSINHIGIRIANKSRSRAFYELLGFEVTSDTGFDDGHPLIMRHPCGVVINLLGLSNQSSEKNILMDVPELYSGVTHVALTVESLESARQFMQQHEIPETGAFSFGGMSAVFMRDPDRNVIELDAYTASDNNSNGYAHHPG